MTQPRPSVAHAQSALDCLCSSSLSHLQKFARELLNLEKGGKTALSGHCGTHPAGPRP